MDKTSKRYKKTETVAIAFHEIFKNGKRKPKILWTDKRSEFVRKHFKEFLKKNILHYMILRMKRNRVLYRWNRTMKYKMWKMFSANNNTVYWDKLNKLVGDLIRRDILPQR